MPDNVVWPLYNEFSDLLKSSENPVVILLTLFRGTFGKDFGASRTFFHYLNYYYPELQNEALGDGKSRFIGIMVPILERGISEGYFNKDLHPEIALTGTRLTQFLFYHN
jgi:hypothetical protein